MKNMILITLFGFLYVSCGENTEISEEPEEPEIPCGCCDVEPVENYIWYPELTVWDYPMKFGTEEWWAEKWRNGSHYDRAAALQIPDDILHALSTKDLTDICLQYPLLTYYIMCWSMDNAFCWTCDEDIVIIFNGIAELFEREDGLKELFSRYDKLLENIAVNCTDYNMEPYRELEFLLSRYQTNDENTVESYREILRYMVKGYNTYLIFPDLYNRPFLYFNLYASACVIDKIVPGALSTTYDKCMPRFYDYDQVVQIANQLIQ